MDTLKSVKCNTQGAKCHLLFNIPLINNKKKTNLETWSRLLFDDLWLWSAAYLLTQHTHTCTVTEAIAF